MNDERRYSEAEIAEIFERAAESQQSGHRHPVATTGMTLAQLQEIGRDVGIPAELVTEAARSLDRPAPAPAAGRTYLGLPIGVGRTVELGRRMTDEEWERLVVECRETFDARGTVRQEGSLRQWTNGNLQVLVEPGENGHRVRLRTTRGDAVASLWAGIVATGAGAVGMIALALGVATRATDVVVAPAAMLVAGIGVLTYLAFRQPRWARERARQMEEIAARLVRP
jgi:hypothetical protein